MTNIPGNRTAPSDMLLSEGLGEWTMPEGKICVICGKDVSGKPRRKDSSGRYACEDCASKRTDGVWKDLGDTAVEEELTLELAKPKQAPRPVVTLARPDAPEPDYFASAHQRLCPECGAFLVRDSPTCVSCGKAVPIDAFESGPVILPPREFQIFGFKISDFIPGFRMTTRKEFVAWITLFTGLLSLGTTNQSWFYFSIACGILFLVWVYVLTIRAALQERRPGWAVTGIIGALVVPLNVSMFLYGFFLTRDRRLRMLWIVTVLVTAGAILLHALMFPHVWEVYRAKLMSGGPSKK